MKDSHAKFLSAFCGGTILTGIIMEKLFSEQNIILPLILGLALALILSKPQIKTKPE